MKKANIPIFVAHKGCPNDCVFCNQRRITGTDGTMDAQKCEAIIKEWMGYISGEAEIVWDEISLQDIVEQAHAKLYLAQAEKLTGEQEETE